MGSRVVLGVASQLKARVREVIQDGRSIFTDNGGLKPPSHFIRFITYNYEERSSLFKSTRKRRRAPAGRTAYNPLQGGSTLREAVAKLMDQVNKGISVNSFAYTHVLQRCSKEKDLDSLKEVHDVIKKKQMEQHPYVANMLLKCYIENGRLETAQEIFYKLLKKNTEIWNRMIAGFAKHDQADDAIDIYKKMENEGGQPNAVTYLCVLKACARPTALKWGKDIHSHIIRDGFQADVRIGSTLVRMYTDCGSIEDARAVFCKLARPDVVCWTVMIGGLAQHGLGREAFSLFLQMQREGLTPDRITYLSILNPCSSTGAAEWVKEVHAHAVKARLDVDVQVGTALVQMYAKSGCIEDARAVFSRLGRRDVFSWNVMVGGLAEHGLGREAFCLFLQMLGEGFTPDATTYLNILNPCSSAGAIEWVREVHAHAAEAGFDVDLQVGTAFIQMYAKSGSIEDARAVFARLRRRDVVSWTRMIGGLAEHGLGLEAFSLFHEMQREGFAPDRVTYLSILNPCSSIGAVEWVKELHAHATQAGLDVDLQVGNAFVQMYAKTGLLADAKQFFDKMPVRDVISGIVMIGGLAQHGYGSEALQLFEEMKSNGVKPSDALFLVVLSACNHAGLVEEGRLQFDSMKQDYGIEPSLEHYNCMVDMLGRAGRLEEAKSFIMNMPIKPNEVTWIALLGACRTHKNLELAELAAKECLKLNPKVAPPYVLLANVYAAVGNWDQVALIRGMMQKRGVRKDPGRCWIEVGNNVHHFSGGDTSHPETRDIYTMLSSLSDKLKAEGYIADTRLVLWNIAEDDKEGTICSHSEKLAIAYGLMHVPLGKPIRIYKNLRICTDCHAATKLVSKITGRDIVARDVIRFHHFRDGSCSCGDYW